MRIVAADPNDAAAIDLIQALDAETSVRYPQEPVFGIDADGFVQRGGVFLLGYLEGAAIACGALRPLNARTFEIKRMYVRPEFRGRGLSRKIFSKLEMVARDRCCSTLKLETGHKQPEALGLYRSVGFAATDRFGPYVGNEYSVCFAKVVPDNAELEFLSAFENCTLPAAEWTHPAHIKMAWLYLTQSPSVDALEKIRSGILRFNTEVLGRRQEYHDTVTVAFARLISDRIRPGEHWTLYVRRIDDILSSESPVLATYYSKGLLSSAAARAHFVEPDLRSLPVFHDA